MPGRDALERVLRFPLLGKLISATACGCAHVMVSCMLDIFGPIPQHQKVSRQQPTRAPNEAIVTALLRRVLLSTLPTYQLRILPARPTRIAHSSHHHVRRYEANSRRKCASTKAPRACKYHAWWHRTYSRRREAIGRWPYIHRRGAKPGPGILPQLSQATMCARQSIARASSWFCRRKPSSYNRQYVNMTRIFGCASSRGGVGQGRMLTSEQSR